MKIDQRAVSIAALTVLLTTTAGLVAAQGDDWRQWGGPDRDFRVEEVRLAASWPPEGPPELWSRPLGHGHSAIVIDGGRLFTMYRPRPGDLPDGEYAAEEVVIGLDAGTGGMLWEHRYPSAPMNFRFGAGPHSTPLVVGDRLFAAGTNKQLFAFDKVSGELLWSHDLVAEFGAPPTLVRPAVKAGYACSPLAYGETIIVTAGGEGQSVMAFSQADGSVVWRSGDFLISPASPILIRLGGVEQLVVFGGQSVHGLDPASGALLWSHPHDTRGDMNNSTPVWGQDRILFVSSAYDGGSRALRLETSAEGTEVGELWFSNKLRIMFGNAIRIGDMVVGSSGDFGPSFLAGVDVRTGELLWQERGFARTSFLLAGDKLVLLDEDGQLALATADRRGLEVHARATVFDTTSWTVPTLVGSTLYLRDREKIVALELPTE